MHLNTVLAFFGKCPRQVFTKSKLIRWVRIDLVSRDLGTDMAVLIAVSHLADCGRRHSRRLFWWRA